MSEFQSYEFVCFDRALTHAEMAKLRSISTRAEITRTRFYNEYNFGDLKADPADLLAQYFDAFFYLSNWGHRRVMLRLPVDSVDFARLRKILPAATNSLRRRGRWAVLDLNTAPEEVEDEWWEIEGFDAWSLGPVREAVMAGDLRTAFLGYLLAVQREDVHKRRSVVPEIPDGIGELDSPHRRLVDVLGVDLGLLRAAAKLGGSSVVDLKDVRRWIRAMPPSRMAVWLIDAAENPMAPLGTKLMRAFRKQQTSSARKAVEADQHTLGRLLDLAADLDADGDGDDAELVADAVRERHLERRRKNWRSSWHQVESLVGEKHYEAAALLVGELLEAAEGTRREKDYVAELDALRKKYPRRRGFWSLVD